MLETPLRELLARRRHGAVLEVVNQLELAADGLDRIAFLSARDEHLENVVGVAGAVLKLSMLVIESFEALNSPRRSR